MKGQIIRAKKLAEKLGISTTTLWRMEKKGELPEKIQIGSRAVGWLSTDIENFIASRRLAAGGDNHGY